VSVVVFDPPIRTWRIGAHLHSGSWLWRLDSTYYLCEEERVLIRFDDDTYGVCREDALDNALAQLGFEALHLPRPAAVASDWVSTPVPEEVEQVDYPDPDDDDDDDLERCDDPSCPYCN
jgi:hypothetical protein